MPRLSFQVDGAKADESAAAPLLLFQLSIRNEEVGHAVQNIALRCQIRIDARRRRYSDQEQARLIELFGEPDRWSSTLTSLLWTHATTVVPPFDDQITVNLPIPCTFDFNVAATKYFAGLDEGEVPLELQFSGTVFYRDKSDALQIAQIPWDQDVPFRLPIDCWRTMMDRHYPNSAWLRLRRDVFDRLAQYKVAAGQPNWETTIERLLSMAEQEATL